MCKLPDRRFRLRGEQSLERDEADETWAVEDGDVGRRVEGAPEERVARSAGETISVGARYVVHRKIRGGSAAALR
jgi:hypothetical protein